MVLIGAIALMVLLALFAVVAGEIVGRGNLQLVNQVDEAAALAGAHAGSEHYFEYLEGLGDWTTAASQGSFTVGTATVNTAVDSAAAGEVTFTTTATSNTLGLSDATSRSVTRTADNFPAAFNFALITSVDTARTRLRSGTDSTGSVVTGDIWGAGGGDVDVGNTVQGGKFYIPDDESFTADAGTYVGKQIPAAEEPAFPAVSFATHQATMNAWDVQLAGAGGSNRTLNNANMNINTHAWCAGAAGSRTCVMNRFSTRGATVNITGSGTIICADYIRLHYRSGETGTLTVTPDAGGHITFLALNNLWMGHANGGGTLNINTSAASTRVVNFYNQAAGGTSNYLRVRGYQTTVNNAANPDTTVNYYSRHRIQIQDSAQLLGQNLFIIDDNTAYAGSATNNCFQLTGDTATGDTYAEGVVLVRRQGTGDAVLFSGGYSAGPTAKFRGLIFSIDPVGALGECDIDDAEIEGAVVCEKLAGNQIRRTNLIYDPTALPAALPTGFTASIRRKPSSWDGL